MYKNYIIYAEYTILYNNNDTIIINYDLIINYSLNATIYNINSLIMFTNILLTYIGML